MRILIDIGHPGHVLLFKNFIKEMQKRGHEFCVTARDKEVTFRLLKANNIPYINRGKGYSGLKKIIGIPLIDYKIYKIAKKFKPDIFIGGVGNLYIAQVAKIMGKPSYIFDDTEFAIFQLNLMKPFATHICTPACYWKNLGKKQIRYNGYHEIAYLHPKYFTPDPLVLKELGLRNREKFFVIRLVSWSANHDTSDSGFIKIREFIKDLEKKGKIIISSEKELPPDLKKYEMKDSLKDKIHDVLYYATLFIGESATMTSECAVLGTPAIFISTSRRGYTNEEESKYDLVYTFDSENREQEAMKKAVALLSRKNLKNEWRKKSKIMLKDKIDVTEWMVKLIERANCK